MRCLLCFYSFPALPIWHGELFQAVTLDCDLSCAESVDCNTAGLVQAIQSFLHLDLYMFFIWQISMTCHVWMQYNQWMSMQHVSFCVSVSSAPPWFATKGMTHPALDSLTRGFRMSKIHFLSSLHFLFAAKPTAWTTGLSRAQRLKQECHVACFQLFILQYLSAFAIFDVELVRCNLLQHSGTSVFKEDKYII